MNFFKTKLKKLLIGKYYGNFKNLFRGTGMDIKDFKQYEVGDDTKHINWKLSSKYDKLFLNVLGEQKDTDVDIFFDINRNFLGGVDNSNIDHIMDFTKDLFLYAKRFGANIKGYFFANKKLNFIKMNDETSLFKILTTIQNFSQKSGYGYSSNINEFLRNQKKIGKKRMIIIISDFLQIDESSAKTLKSLGLKNELFLLKLKVDFSLGKNFDLFDINKSKKYDNGLRFTDLN